MSSLSQYCNNESVSDRSIAFSSKLASFVRPEPDLDNPSTWKLFANRICVIARPRPLLCPVIIAFFTTFSFRTFFPFGFKSLATTFRAQPLQPQAGLGKFLTESFANVAHPSFHPPPFQNRSIGAFDQRACDKSSEALLCSSIH